MQLTWPLAWQVQVLHSLGMDWPIDNVIAPYLQLHGTGLFVHCNYEKGVRERNKKCIFFIDSSRVRRLKRIQHRLNWSKVFTVFQAAEAENVRPWSNRPKETERLQIKLRQKDFMTQFRMTKVFSIHLFIAMGSSLQFHLSIIMYTLRMKVD